MAGVLEPFRPGTHLPPVQAGPGLGRPQDPRPGRRGPVDLADHRRLRPAPPNLARALTADLRLPWERPAPAGRLTPARVRRGFRNIRATIPSRASAPKPSKPGRGRPPGSRNRRPAPRHDVGKTTKRKTRSQGETRTQVKRQANLSEWSQRCQYDGCRGVRKDAKMAPGTDGPAYGRFCRHHGSELPCLLGKIL